jgi:hypothetical protein
MAGRAVGDVTVPLVEGGDTIPVTDEHKRDWLLRLLSSEMVSGYGAAACHFRQGFVDVVGCGGRVDASNAELCRWTTPHFFLLSASELQNLWSGATVSRHTGFQTVHSPPTPCSALCGSHSSRTPPTPCSAQLSLTTLRRLSHSALSPSPPIACIPLTTHHSARSSHSMPCVHSSHN